VNFEPAPLSAAARRRTRATCCVTPVVGGNLDARQLRRAAEELVDGGLVEGAAAQPVWTAARRRRRAAEHFRFAVEQSLQPDGRAVAAQRVGAEPEVLEQVEDHPQAGVKRDDVVAVQPEVLDGGVERQEDGRREVAQRAVVQVEPGGGETAERAGYQLHVTIAVEKQMLQTHAAKRRVLERLHNEQNNRAQQLYKNISMLFLFPVKDGKLNTGVNATFNAS